MILQTFSQFIAKEPLRHYSSKSIAMQIAPLDLLQFLHKVPGRKNRGGGGACRPDSGEGARRRLGEVGEEIEEVASYLVVCSVRVGTAGGGSSACSSMPAAAWLGNERGNDVNVVERGEHEHQ